MSNFFLNWAVTFTIWGLIYLFCFIIAKLFQLVFKISHEKIKNFLQTILILLLFSLPFIIYYGPKASLLLLFFIFYLGLWVNITLFIIKIFDYFYGNYAFVKKLSSLTSTIFGKFVFAIVIIFWGLLFIDTAENIGKFLSNNYYFVKYLK